MRCSRALVGLSVFVRGEVEQCAEHTFARFKEGICEWESDKTRDSKDEERKELPLQDHQ